jgi:hypothetical protein
MGSFSLWHWIILILFLVLNGVPIAKILGRAGLNKWWTIAFLVPFPKSRSVVDFRLRPVACG